MDREFSVETGFRVVMRFLTDFWWTFLKGVMIERRMIHEDFYQKKSLEDVLHDDNYFFFIIVCDGTSYDYFRAILKQRGIVTYPREGREIKIKEDFLFQLAIDFCSDFNKKYQEGGKDSLRFAINWLLDMKKNRRDHQKEWEIWAHAMKEVLEKRH